VYLTEIARRGAVGVQWAVHDDRGAPRRQHYSLGVRRSHSRHHLRERHCAART
jgi:hypothetical protein